MQNASLFMNVYGDFVIFNQEFSTFKGNTNKIHYLFLYNDFYFIHFIPVICFLQTSLFFSDSIIKHLARTNLFIKRGSIIF